MNISQKQFDLLPMELQSYFDKDTINNNHTTVKSIKLMQYFVTLITPPNGTVLDPFSGSGSTGVAALLKGFDFIGVEKELGHYNLAKERLTNCKASLIQPPSTNA